MAKRLFDIVVAAAALVILSPLFVVIGLLVKLTSPGPVFFTQLRIGVRGQPFRIVKFRSMRRDSVGAAVTVRGDLRITAFGHFLRRWKLDEIPQFLNVLAGHMSLVGPRPELPKYVNMYPDAIRDRVLSVRPGLTDPITLELRNEEDVLSTYDEPVKAYVEQILPRKLKAYVAYVDSRTFVGDIVLLFRTAWAIFFGGHSEKRSLNRNHWGEHP